MSLLASGCRFPHNTSAKASAKASADRPYAEGTELPRCKGPLDPPIAHSHMMGTPVKTNIPSPRVTRGRRYPAGSRSARDKRLAS